MDRFGISTGCFYDRSLLSVIDVLADKGFATLEMCSNPMHLDYTDAREVEKAAARLEEKNMRVESFHAPFGSDIDVSSPDPKQQEQSLETIRTAVDAAHTFKARFFTIHPGPETQSNKKDATHARRMNIMINSLEQIRKKCCEYGVTLALENILPHLDFGNHTERDLIFNAVSSEGKGFCLDTGHAFLEKRLERILNRYARFLSLIHAHDNNGSRDNHLEPGKGKIDWSRFFQRLEQTGYNGPIIIELDRCSGESDAECLDRATRGIQYLKQMEGRSDG